MCCISVQHLNCSVDALKLVSQGSGSKPNCAAPTAPGARARSSRHLLPPEPHLSLCHRRRDSGRLRKLGTARSSYTAQRGGGTKNQHPGSLPRTHPSRHLTSAPHLIPRDAVTQHYNPLPGKAAECLLAAQAPQPTGVWLVQVVLCAAGSCVHGGAGSWCNLQPATPRTVLPLPSAYTDPAVGKSAASRTPRTYTASW